MPRQLLQNFRHQSGRDAVFFGDFVGAAGMHLAAMQGKMLHCDKAVIGFFGKFKHPPVPCPFVHATSEPYATESVGIQFMRFPVKSQLVIFEACEHKCFVLSLIWGAKSCLSCCWTKTRNRCSTGKRIVTETEKTDAAGTERLR